MGSGIALSIREKYPEVFSAYKKMCENNKECGNSTDALLGTCQIVRCYYENKYVANLFGQDRYGYDGKQYTNINALKVALETLCNYAKSNNLSVGLPFMIGSARGGANWDDVYRLIDIVFKDYEVTLYKFNP